MWDQGYGGMNATTITITMDTSNTSPTYVPSCWPADPRERWPAPTVVVSTERCHADPSRDVLTVAGRLARDDRPVRIRSAYMAPEHRAPGPIRHRAYRREPQRASRQRSGSR